MLKIVVFWLFSIICGIFIVTRACSLIVIFLNGLAEDMNLPTEEQFIFLKINQTNLPDCNTNWIKVDFDFTRGKQVFYFILKVPFCFKATSTFSRPLFFSLQHVINRTYPLYASPILLDPFRRRWGDNWGQDNRNTIKTEKDSESSRKGTY